MKELFKSYFCFYLGSVFPFLIWISILWIFYDSNPFVIKPPVRFPSSIMLLVISFIAAFLFLPYFTWLKCRLTKDFYRLKWYIHTISGFLLVLLFFTAMYISVIYIKSIEKSKHSSWWYILIFCFFSFLLAEINYQLKKHNKLRLNKQLDIKQKPAGNSTFRDGFS